MTKKDNSIGKGRILLAILFVAFCILISLNRGSSYSQQQKPVSPPTQTTKPSNIGRHAYNATNGVWRGKIVGYKACRTQPSMNCYVVNRGEGYGNEEAPESNVVVRSTAPEN